MKTMRSLLVVLSVALGLVVFGPSTAYACSCVQSSPRDFFDRADVVVEGTVTDADGSGLTGAGTTRYLVEVDGVFKGEATERLTFGSASSSAACGLEGVEVDKRTVFFLSWSDGEEWEPDTALVANSCGGTGQVTAAQAARLAGGAATSPEQAGPAAGKPGGRTVTDEVAAVREPEPGGPSRLWPTTGEWATYAGAAALLVLAIALLARVARRGRSDGAGHDVAGQ